MSFEPFWRCLTGHTPSPNLTGGGKGSPLQCSCLENLRDRGAWLAAVHRVAENQIRLKEFNTHTHTHTPPKSEGPLSDLETVFRKKNTSVPASPSPLHPRRAESSFLAIQTDGVPDAYTPSLMATSLPTPSMRGQL